MRKTEKGELYVRHQPTATLHPEHSWKRLLAPWAMAAISYFLFCPHLSYGQPDLNLDFEKLGQWPSKPARWSIFGDPSCVMVDRTTPRTGTYALRITARDAGSRGVRLSFPISLIAGKKLVVNGSVHVFDAADRAARILCSAFGRTGPLQEDGLLLAHVASSPAEAGQPPTFWKRHTLTLDVPAHASNAYLAVQLTGRGDVLFDSLDVFIDGIPYDRAFKAHFTELTTAQERWLREHSCRLSAVDPGSGFDGLQSIRQWVGNASIVALGEATHGTRDFFRLKHHLVELLVENMGFTLIAIEGGMAETELLNDYIVNGHGNIRELLRLVYGPAYRSEELYDLLLWLRDVNKTRQQKVRLRGFDISSPEASLAHIKAYLKHRDAEYYQRFQSADALLPTIATNKECQQRIARLASEFIRDFNIARRSTAPKNRPDASLEWAIQNARCIDQWVAMNRYQEDPAHDNSYRDRRMADNFEWIRKDCGSEPKTIVWAHNGHVARAPGSMAVYLSRRHPKLVRVLGISCNEGRYLTPALSDHKQVAVHGLVPCYLGTLEWSLRSVPGNCIFVDLRGANKGDDASAWLFNRIGMRMAHTEFSEEQFWDTTVAEEFDGVIVVKKTSAATVAIQTP